MKKTFLLVVLSALLYGGCQTVVDIPYHDGQGEVTISYDNLPKKAREFIEDCGSREDVLAVRRGESSKIKVISCTKAEYCVTKRAYQVSFGVEGTLVFDRKGNCTLIGNRYGINQSCFFQKIPDIHTMLKSIEYELNENNTRTGRDDKIVRVRSVQITEKGYLFRIDVEESLHPKIFRFDKRGVFRDWGIEI